MRSFSGNGSRCLRGGMCGRWIDRRAGLLFGFEWRSRLRSGREFGELVRGKRSRIAKRESRLHREWSRGRRRRSHEGGAPDVFLRGNLSSESTHRSSWHGLCRGEGTIPELTRRSSLRCGTRGRRRRSNMSFGASRFRSSFGRKKERCNVLTLTYR